MALSHFLDELNFGLESDNFEEPETKSHEVEITELNDEDENEVPAGGLVDAEVAEINVEADELREDGDKAERAHAALESLYDVLEASLENGGLSPQAAQIANLFAEQYTAECADESPIASTEAFGGSCSSFKATQISMEGVSEALKKVWATIVAILKKLGTFIGAAFNKVTFAAKRLEGRAAKIAKAAADARRLPAKGKVDIGGRSLLFIGGKYDANGARDLEYAARLMWNDYPKAVQNYMSSCSRVLEGLKSKPGTTVKMLMGLNVSQNFARIGKPLAGSNVPFNREGAAVFKTQDFPGDFAIYTVLPNFADETGLTTGKLKASTGLHFLRNPQAKTPESFELPNPAATEIYKNASTILKAVKTITGAKAYASTLQSDLNKLVSEADKADTTENEGLRKDASAARALIISLRGLIGKQYVGTQFHMLRCIGAQLQLYKEQLKGLGAKVDEAVDNNKLLGHD